MARVLALVEDLLFGSQVQGLLTAAGHEVELVPAVGRVSERLADEASPAVEVLVVDLTDERLERARVVAELTASGALANVRTLGFYSHVDADARESAERAGFDLVVPRSRMAREGGALTARLASGGGGRVGA